MWMFSVSACIRDEWSLILLQVLQTSDLEKQERLNIEHDQAEREVSGNIKMFCILSQTGKYEPEFLSTT